jgi:hypothetical protein
MMGDYFTQTSWPPYRSATGYYPLEYFCRKCWQEGRPTAVLKDARCRVCCA